MDYIEYLSNYGIGALWDSWTEDTYVSIANQYLTKRIYLYQNGKTPEIVYVPKIENFQEYPNGVKIARVTDHVIVGIHINAETNFIDAITTACVLNTQNVTDEDAFNAYTLGSIFLSDENFSGQDAIDIMQTLYDGLLESKTKTITRNGVQIKAIYTENNNQLRFIIQHV